MTNLKITVGDFHDEPDKKWFTMSCGKTTWRCEFIMATETIEIYNDRNELFMTTKPNLACKHEADAVVRSLTTMIVGYESTRLKEFING